MSRWLLFNILGFLVFIVGLSVFDFNSLRKTFLQSGPSQDPVISISLPENVAVNQPFDIRWTVDTVTPRFTTGTSIYWSQDSSPSALSKTDKPDVVSYTNNLTDYLNTNIELPAQFVGSLTLSQPGTYYFRAHSLIEGQNYWTPEISLVVK